MRKPILGTNVAIFLLFFGVALLDALGSGRWVAALFWLAIGAMFLRADAFKPKRDEQF